LSSSNVVCTAIEVAIRRWANRVGFPERRTAELIDMIGAAVDDAAKRIRNLGEDHSFENAQDTTQDPIIAALESILNGKVGYPLPSHELVEARKAARQRILDRIPPGWKDSGKRENPDGDYLIWYQTLMEAKHRGVNVLFVTGDVKDDWWWKEHGEARGPLPELVHEMQTVANVRLFMLRPESLLKHAGHILGISVSKESVQDAARVSSKESIGWSTGTGSNQVTQAYSYPTATVWANYNDPMAAYSFPLTFGVAAPWTYGNATTSTISPLLPIERAPSNEQEFARKAQRIASDESIAALSVEGYDASADAVILDSHNWPLSDRTIKRIAEAAQSLRVKYRLQTSPRL
jgi:hypothetical protein